MPILKKIIFLLLPILSFSCQTQLEKQGWQRTATVTQVDTSTIRKDNELVVQKMHDKSSYAYSLYTFNKDSTGKIIKHNWGGWVVDNLNSDIAYYKWDSDSVCHVKLLNQGNVQASIKLSSNGSSTTMQTLDERKK